MSPVAELIGLITGITALIGLIYKVVTDIRKDRRERAQALERAPLDREKAEADLAEQAQRIAAGAIATLEAQMARAEEEHGHQLSQLRADILRLREDHAQRIAQLETQHDREKHTWEIERENMQSEIAVLKDALRAAEIDVPTFAPRTA